MDERESFATLLREHLRDRGLAGASALERLVRDHFTALGWPALGTLSRQTITNWLGTARHPPRRPRALEEVLKVAHALSLTGAETSRLLRAARLPVLAQLRADARRPTRSPYPLPPREILRVLLARWADEPPHRLPTPLTSFVGRETEVEELAVALARPATRLLTLTGPGGVGKTRLALEAARLALDAFAGGVWFVPLDTETDTDGLLAAILRALGLPVGEPATREMRLGAHLANRELLLVLDTMEHLPVEARAAAAALLTRAPSVKVLATSRAALRVYGEHLWPVAPLPLPSGAPSLRALAVNPAVALFAARARAVTHGFQLTTENALDVALLCARLDGLPLALELAAARVRDAGAPRRFLAAYTTALDPDDVGPLDHPPRHRSLRQALAWSHALLNDAEQRLFRRLAVLPGGTTVASAAAVAALDEAAATGGLAALAGVSLLAHVDSPGALPARYVMLATLREYALERLGESGEENVARRGLLDWALALVAEETPYLAADRQRAGWLACLDAERDNLVAALAWAEAHDPSRGLALAARLWPYWFLRGDQANFRARLARLLAHDGARDRDRAGALLGLGYLSIWHDLPAAREALEQALDAGAAFGDQWRAGALMPLVMILVALGEGQAAMTRLAEARRLLAATSDPGLAGLLIAATGYAEEARGELPAALSSLGKALSSGRKLEFPLLTCFALVRLGPLWLARGDVKQAEAAFRELRETAMRLGADRYVALADFRLGTVAEWRGAVADAEALYRAALALAEAAGEVLARAHALTGLGRLALRGGDYNGAVALLEDVRAIEAGHQDIRGAAILLPLLALARQRQGWTTDAALLLAQGLSIAARLGPGVVQVEALELAATFAGELAADQEAAAWWAAATAERKVLGLVRSPVAETAVPRAPVRQTVRAAAALTEAAAWAARLAEHAPAEGTRSS